MTYNDLPEQLRADISEREWLHLTEAGRARYLEEITEPEEEEFIDD